MNDHFKALDKEKTYAYTFLKEYELLNLPNEDVSKMTHSYTCQNFSTAKLILPLLYECSSKEQKQELADYIKTHSLKTFSDNSIQKLFNGILYEPDILIPTLTDLYRILGYDLNVYIKIKKDAILEEFINQYTSSFTEKLVLYSKIKRMSLIEISEKNLGQSRFYIYHLLTESNDKWEKPMLYCKTAEVLIKYFDPGKLDYVLHFNVSKPVLSAIRTYITTENYKNALDYLSRQTYTSFNKFLERARAANGEITKK